MWHTPRSSFIVAAVGTLIAQLLLGVLFGLVGVILSTSIATASLVVERAYVRAVIEKPAEDGIYDEEAENDSSRAASGPRSRNGSR